MYHDTPAAATMYCLKRFENRNVYVVDTACQASYCHSTSHAQRWGTYMQAEARANSLAYELEELERLAAASLDHTRHLEAGARDSSAMASAVIRTRDAQLANIRQVVTPPPPSPVRISVQSGFQGCERIVANFMSAQRLFRAVGSQYMPKISVILFEGIRQFSYCQTNGWRDIIRSVHTYIRYKHQEGRACLSAWNMNINATAFRGLELAAWSDPTQNGCNPLVNTKN